MCSITQSIPESGDNKTKKRTSSYKVMDVTKTSQFNIVVESMHPTDNKSFVFKRKMSITQNSKVIYEKKKKKIESVHFFFSFFFCFSLYPFCFLISI